MSVDRVIREVAHGSAEYWAEVALRDAVLRRPLGLRLSAEDLDAETNSIHIVCCLAEKLVGCLVLCPLQGTDMRMRQVAVDPELQRQGIGQALVAYAEAMVRKAGCRRMLLHARETAAAFYEKLGYAIAGQRFVEVTIPHWVMEKQFNR